MAITLGMTATAPSVAAPQETESALSFQAGTVSFHPDSDRAYNGRNRGADTENLHERILVTLPTSEHRMMATEPKVKGPASYFPSIEKAYEKPIEHWFEIVKKAGPLKHMELVNVLKTKHQIGHGHANAIVAYFLAKKS